MSDVAAVPFPSSAWVDAIPVVWVEPHTGGARRLDPGKPDAYAQAFYDTLNPLTHLDAYAHGPAIRFVCGADDTHVPPDGALRFREALAGAPSAERVQVELIPGMGHTNADPARWWPACLAWLTA